MKKIIIVFFTLIITISCKNESQQVTKIEGDLLPINESISSKKSIENFIQPYREKVESEMNTIISYTPKDLSREDAVLESSLGNLMADLCYERANPVFKSRTGKNIDFAMFNYGGIRAGITKGPITNQNAFKLMPFENSLVVVEMTSEKLNELVEYLIAQNTAHPLSKHVKMVIAKDGSTYNFKLDNLPINNTKTYFVLTHDYLQNGGDRMVFFKNPVNLYKLDYKVRNAIIDYFNENDTIKVELDGRFIKEN